MRISETSDLWWKSAVFYCADVQTFLDLDSDGYGDFRGMAHRIDYLADLGITCLWLMPFYPTSSVDDGYDITDFYGVDERLGTLGCFVELIRTAHSRGIRVIIDFVMNHTSAEHPWFRNARSSKDARYRNWYVWRTATPPDTSGQVVFPDAEDSIWTFDEKTGQYYLHHFYSSQPDLNIANPEVREEIERTLGFWLELGVDGFRVDAVPFLFNTEDVPPEERIFPEYDPHGFLRSLRSFLSRRSGDAILLGEVNVPHEQQFAFFGGDDADELTMQFDFLAMQAFYLSCARREAEPLIAALQGRPVVGKEGQWGIFLRNHDELTLDKLTENERQEVFDAFGPEPEHQLFGRGLRRRLPTMFEGDPRRIRMAYSLMFSLPGTPVLFYGEEIGMAENLDIQGRLAVRSPMQWADTVNGGFSTADPQDLVRPVVDGAYGPGQVNAFEQRNDPESLLSFLKTLISAHRRSPEIGFSDFHALDASSPHVFAHLVRAGEWALVPVHNLAPEPVDVEITGLEFDEGMRLVNLLGDDEVKLGANGALSLTLDGYGFRWLRVMTDGEIRLS